MKYTVAITNPPYTKSLYYRVLKKLYDEVQIFSSINPFGKKLNKLNIFSHVEQMSKEESCKYFCLKYSNSLYYCVADKEKEKKDFSDLIQLFDNPKIIHKIMSKHFTPLRDLMKYDEPITAFRFPMMKTNACIFKNTILTPNNPDFYIFKDGINLDKKLKWIDFPRNLNVNKRKECFHIPISSYEEGLKIHRYFENKLIKYIVCSEHNVYITYYKVPALFNLNNEQLYEYFDLTEDEINEIENFLIENPKRVKKCFELLEHENRERSLSTSTYFSPKPVVDKLISFIPEKYWEDPQATFFEPCAGDGNIVLSILEKRMKYVDPLTALNTTFANEILEHLYIRMKERVHELMDKHLDPSIIDEIIEKNITNEDYLKL